ncbi:MAG: class I SAM-dependent methyltransferase [Pseudobdellovibrionaceae bacterium]
MKCLLCEYPNSSFFKVVKKPERSYFLCSNCDLIFMNPEERLDAQQEKIRYDYHQNQETSGYTAFLEPLINDVHSYFSAAGLDSSQLSSLDFGCGPTAYLSKLLEKKGYQTQNYDPFYFPEQDLLRRKYHLITCTEVWEHLYRPQEDIDKLLRLLKTGGLLAVMTSAHHGAAVFSDWYYRRDLTHVTFFSEKTMKWLADEYNLRMIKRKSPYWIFQKML